VNFFVERPAAPDGTGCAMANTIATVDTINNAVLRRNAEGARVLNHPMVVSQLPSVRGDYSKRSRAS
jgi:hypothetical protein